MADQERKGKGGGDAGDGYGSEDSADSLPPLECESESEPESEPESRYNSILVDTLEGLMVAEAALAAYSEVAFDCEGRNLSRTGDLTVACFLGIGERRFGPAYVVDVQRLGGETVFARRHGGLLDLLEKPDTTKVTFDCRGDSDALFHQFGVTLRGVLDVQVLDQAVRIRGGERPPTRRGQWRPFVSGMARVSERYLSADERKELGHHLAAPHKDDSDIWVKRPLTEDAVRYAAADVFTNALLLRAMRKTVGNDDRLMRRVRVHSERYAAFFRGRSRAPKWPDDKYFILEEHSIMKRWPWEHSDESDDAEDDGDSGDDDGPDRSVDIDYNAELGRAMDMFGMRAAKNRDGVQ